jgi:phage host-nuclease inhibitor protein Gam
MSGRVKTEAARWVPQTREEVTDAIAEIGALQRDLQDLQVRMNDELSAVKLSYEREAEGPALRIDALKAGVQIWCDANRRELTHGDKTKTAHLGSGEVSWHLTPPRVTIRAADVVMEDLRRRGLTRFIRTVDEINKEAILADKDAVAGVKGITISQKEEFIIKPFEAQLETGAA